MSYARVQVFMQRFSFLVATVCLLSLITSCIDSPEAMFTETVQSELAESPPLLTGTETLVVENSAPSNSESGTPGQTQYTPPSLTPTEMQQASAETPSGTGLTPTPKPPPPSIQILSPGPLSKVVSPIWLRASVYPGQDGRVYVELVGEDGRLLWRRYQVYSIDPSRSGLLVVDIPFEIRAAAELGRIQLYTMDSFGRFLAVTSVHVILQSEGYAQINPATDTLERVIIDNPISNATITGGLVIVEGRVRPYSDFPWMISLVDEDGVVINYGMFTVTPAEDDGYVPFVADVSYQVLEPRRVRLTIRQLDSRIEGTMYLCSREIVISP